MAEYGMVGKACSAMKATSNGVFQGDNPLDFALPLAILQITLVVIFTRGLAYLLKPIRQPRVIAEIVGGILLGPSALGRNKEYLNMIFPPKSITVLDTLANLGLLFFLFLVGLELDLNSLRKTGKRAISIAIAGITLPFALGVGTSLVLGSTIAKGVYEPAFLVFMGVSLSITAFPVLARILAELKLLTTDVGQMAMSAAAVNDFVSWILLALAIALTGDGITYLTTIWTLLSGTGFVLVCVFLLPPAFKWMSLRVSEGEPVNELYICLTLTAVLVSGFVTDYIGIHALFGPFVLGILVPKEGAFAVALVDKVEDLVSGLFLPLYFVSSGLKTDVATIHGGRSWGLLALVTTIACYGKIAGTLLVSIIYKMPLDEALALGFLMNTKGLVELIVLNIGKDRKVLNDQTFSIMVLMAIFTTFITTPMVMAIYKPAKRNSKSDYKHRTIQREDQDTQLRILACFHCVNNIPSTINLIEASRGIERKEGICVFAMHLVELSERSSSILMVHRAKKNSLPNWNIGWSDSNKIAVAFEAFNQLNQVSMRPMMAISPLSHMHEDVCNTAERKRASIIILPFHKHQRFDGSLETTRAIYRWINKKVLEEAPCSVGILVDRGLGGGRQVISSHVSSKKTVFFFGGCDDREALVLGARMAEHPGISLDIIRFLPTPEIVGESVFINMDKKYCSTNSTTDEIVLEDYRMRARENSSITYEEVMVSKESEVIEKMKEHSKCNLILVGKMPEGEVVASLNGNNIHCPELGPVGGLLTSPEFATSASVLVVQQFRGE